ncbi:DUF4293 family protein [Ferruginibacter albus]|uniref:DUF4293 family protein n=1 Tax=Ferruginibacter albus TaxID=2875540 RepID=UPI001CC7D21D|nr:DUF4293 family protein [Ferruginibacter albus]UAY52573.1 DUF4293 domain-containing protein [Ferruginibacter albus]
MIQRIQSVWLLLVAAFAVLTFKLPCFNGIHTDGTPAAVTATATIPLIIVSAAITAIALIAVFFYKKRPVQIRLCIVGIILQLLCIYLYYNEIKNFKTGDPTLWSMIYIGGIFFFVFAARAIYKDNKMVKESERLR